MRLFSNISKSFKALFSPILSIFLISDGLQLVSLLILFLFIPLFLIILAVPLDGSWIRTFGEEPNQTATVYGLMFPSQILGYISAVIRGWSVFKDVFSSLIIPLITAYSVKSIGTEEVSYKVRLFLTYLVILLFLSMIGNAMVSAVDLSSISTELNKYDDGTTVPILTLEEINLTKDTITDLQETTSNYVKDCLTYIALTIGITYKNNSKTQ